MSLRVRTVSGLLCGLILLVVTSGALAQAPGNDRVRILVPRGTTSSLPLLLLARQAPLKEVEIRTDLYLSHPQALALLLRGEADLLLTGTSQGWENHIAGGPLVLIDTGVWGVSSLMGFDERIRSMKDLKGKRIALPFPGAPLDFQTRYLLKREGLDAKRDLEISYAPYTQTVPRLLRGDLDAAPLPEPMATELERKGLKRLLVYQEAWAAVSGGDARSPQVSLFSTQSTVKTKRGIFLAIVEEWRKASELVARDPKAAAASFAEALAVAPEVLEGAIPNTLYQVPSPVENRRRVLEYYERVKEFLPGDSKGLADSFFFTP